MELRTRIRHARMKACISQTELAQMVGVTRSAVSNWESTASTLPASKHLQRIAQAVAVSYEWLATGRGDATPKDSDIPAADVELIDDPIERVLIAGFRASNAQIRQALLNIAESQLPRGAGSWRSAGQRERARNQLVG